MSEQNRIFGNNLRLYLSKKQMSLEQLAKKLGYSAYEVHKIIDGRLFLDRKEKEEIAKVLDVTIEMLHADLGDVEYQKAGCFECVGEFSNPVNKKRIFDLFDTYCDIQETLKQENLI